MKVFDFEKCRMLRKEKKETLEEMASAIGITKAALSQIEAGSTNPRLETILKISGHFCHPLEFFLIENETTVVS